MTVRKRHVTLALAALSLLAATGATPRPRWTTS
jgi:hypothetical protein